MNENPARILTPPLPTGPLESRSFGRSGPCPVLIRPLPQQNSNTTCQLPTRGLVNEKGLTVSGMQPKSKALLSNGASVLSQLAAIALQVKAATSCHK